MRKRVLSVLMQGDLVVNLDNIEEPLASQTLCSVLTQESFTDRLLGVNKTATAPTLCCWLATGNNLVIAGDLTTRVVSCVLDPQVERPEEREFDRDLYEWIPANRPRLIREALTVLRAYVVAGRPKQPLKNFARFEDWSNWIRAALVWLGEADPLTGREALEDGDPIRLKLRALLVAWHSAFETAPASTKEAKARALETQLDDDRCTKHPPRRCCGRPSKTISPTARARSAATPWVISCGNTPPALRAVPGSKPTAVTRPVRRGAWWFWTPTNSSAKWKKYRTRRRIPTIPSIPTLISIPTPPKQPGTRILALPTCPPRVGMVAIVGMFPPGKKILPKKLAYRPPPIRPWPVASCPRWPVPPLDSVRKNSAVSAAMAKARHRR